MTSEGRKNYPILKYLAFFSFGLMAGCDGASNSDWPEGGKRAVLKIAGSDYQSLDCYRSEWQREKLEKYKDLKHVSTILSAKECTLNLQDGRWQVYDDVVNGTFRCEKDSYIFEYTISSFRNNDTAYGSYFCTSAHFPVTEEYEPGSVTYVMKTPY